MLKFGEQMCYLWLFYPALVSRYKSAVDRVTKCKHPVAASASLQISCIQWTVDQIYLDTLASFWSPLVNVSVSPHTLLLLFFSCITFLHGHYRGAHGLYGCSILNYTTHSHIFCTEKLIKSMDITVHRDIKYFSCTVFC
jgi:hypothetical protein